MLNVEEKVKLIGLSKYADTLVDSVAEQLSVKQIGTTVSKFSNGETHINVLESVRGQHIYLFQVFDFDINDRIMEILITVDALKRASAKSISLVIPYYAYSRQDRKSKSREPITAKLIADMYEKVGIDRVITMDLHAPQIQGFFDIPIDNYQGAPLLYNYFKEECKNDDIVVVSPDHGGASRARILAEKLSANIAIVDKRRPKANVSEVMNVIGNVEGKVAIIIDDMIDTAGSLCKAAEAVKQLGAKKVFGCCTHPVFSGEAYQRLEESVFEKVVVMNSLSVDETKLQSSRIEVLDVSQLIALAIEHTYLGKSVSPLFNNIEEN